ncbi:MAG: flagellar biosynthesis anti-sigma factor FlgM [Fibrobacterota bacterium]
MNIDGLSQFSLNALKKQVEKPVVDSKRAPEAKTRLAADRFQKSGQAQGETDTAQLVQFAKEAPEVRTEKIEEIRARIAQGFYDFQETQEAIAARLAIYL